MELCFHHLYTNGGSVEGSPYGDHFVYNRVHRFATIEINFHRFQLKLVKIDLNHCKMIHSSLKKAITGGAALHRASVCVQVMKTQFHHLTFSSSSYSTISLKIGRANPVPCFLH